MTSDIDCNQLGKRIKRYRQKAHKTQKHLANALFLLLDMKKEDRFLHPLNLYLSNL